MNCDCWYVSLLICPILWEFPHQIVAQYHASFAHGFIIDNGNNGKDYFSPMWNTSLQILSKSHRIPQLLLTWRHSSKGLSQQSVVFFYIKSCVYLNSIIIIVHRWFIFILIRLSWEWRWKHWVLSWVQCV